MVASSVRFALALSTLAALAVGCSAPDTTSDEDDLTAKTPTENWKRDIVSTDLRVDVASRRATATISVAASTRTGASFEVQGLDVEAVRTASGAAAYRVHDGQLDVALAAKKPAEITIDYTFQQHAALEGATKGGLTFLWPTYCGNLFPCKSMPSDGVRLGLDLEGVPAGERAIYAQDIPADAPSYMLAWAIGDYTTKKLGATKAGTTVSVSYLPGEAAAATKGTARLVPAFDWLEQTYGPYIFGKDVGSVSAHWGPGAFGGMEHHPYWHIASDAMGDEETHVHEAAHGWFGDGIRIACWEDLTLSEGTTSYIAARAIEAAGGASAGAAVWASYAERLAAVVASEDRVAWPKATCNEIDVVHDLWNDVVYMKGAYFFRAVEAQIGKAAVDKALRRFYAERHGKAAGMRDLLATLHDETGFDATELAKAWLESLGAPKVP